MFDDIVLLQSSEGSRDQWLDALKKYDAAIEPLEMEAAGSLKARFMGSHGRSQAVLSVMRDFEHLLQRPNIISNLEVYMWLCLHTL